MSTTPVSTPAIHTTPSSAVRLWTARIMSLRAVATHVRAGSPAFEAFAFPVMMGALTWVPLWLRDVRVRALL